jgi:hypothetical protein
MGWGLCIRQDEHGFVQIPDADFFTDIDDYEGIPPHKYDMIYKCMDEDHRREIDMARDEIGLDFARETAKEAFDSARYSDYEDDKQMWKLHRKKMKELQEQMKTYNAAILANKPLVEKTKAEIDSFLIANEATQTKLEKEIDDLKAALQAKEEEYEELMKPLMVLEGTLEEYKAPDKSKRKLQKILNAEKEWATEQ